MIDVDGADVCMQYIIVTGNRDLQEKQIRNGKKEKYRIVALATNKEWGEITELQPTTDRSYLLKQ